MISVYTPRTEAIIRFPEVPNVLAGADDRLALQSVHRPWHGLAVLAMHAKFTCGEAEKPGETVLDFLAHGSAFVGGNRSLEDLAHEGLRPGSHVHRRSFANEPHIGQLAALKGVLFAGEYPLSDMTVHYYTRHEPEFRAMPVTDVTASFGIDGGHGELASAYVRVGGSAAGTERDPAYELRLTMGYVTHEGVPIPQPPSFETLALAGQKLGAFPLQHPRVA
jgi:hypothetical protein